MTTIHKSLLGQSKSTTRSRKVQFDIVVIKVLSLSGSIKPDMWLVHNSRLAIETKMVRSLTNTNKGYHIETSE
jgi:hypothetical protein